MSETERFDADGLARMKAEDLPHCKVGDVWRIEMPENGMTAEAGRETLLRMERAGDYLRHFLPPGERGDCAFCGSRQGGLTAAILGGGFEWGLQHGEGHCSRCGYPARAYHDLKDADGAKVINGALILQYHPDEISFDSYEHEED